jgi:hypothetical protein
MNSQTIEASDPAPTAAGLVFSVQALKGDQIRNDICYDGLRTVLLALALAGDGWSISIQAPNGRLDNSDQLGALLFAYAGF